MCGSNCHDKNVWAGSDATSRLANAKMVVYWLCKMERSGWPANYVRATCGNGVGCAVVGRSQSVGVLILEGESVWDDIIRGLDVGTEGYYIGETVDTAWTTSFLKRLLGTQASRIMVSTSFRSIVGHYYCMARLPLVLFTDQLGWRMAWASRSSEHAFDKGIGILTYVNSEGRASYNGGELETERTLMGRHAVAGSGQRRQFQISNGSEDVALDPLTNPVPYRGIYSSLRPPQ